MSIQKERTVETWRERIIPWCVNRICSLFGWRMLLLSIARVSHHGEVMELEEMRLIRSSGTQRYPSHPLTTALFAGLMEMQMNHLRELQAEQREQRAKPPAQPQVQKEEVVN